MSLRTKSIQKRALKEDGIRVCIMRRPGENVDWDLWLPKLSPSNELLNAYKYEGLSWEDFKKKFNQQVIKKQRKMIELVAAMAEKNEVTLLCWEKEPDHCHRSLIENECRKLMSKSNSDL